MTTTLRSEIWGSLPRYSHSPEPCTASSPCELCNRSIDQIEKAIATHAPVVDEGKLKEILDGLTVKHKWSAPTPFGSDRKHYFVSGKKQAIAAIKALIGGEK